MMKKLAILFGFTSRGSFRSPHIFSVCCKRRRCRLRSGSHYSFRRSLVLLRNRIALAVAGRMWLQRVAEPVDQARRLDDRLHQEEASPRVIVIRQRQDRSAKRRVAAKPLRASDQPQVQLVFGVTRV